MNRLWVKPKRLVPGETIGVVAPAGIVDPERLQRGVKRLEQRGFRVILGKSVEKRHRYLAGEDRDRAEDLHEMFENKEVRAIFCARGGFGSARLIPYLDRRRISGSPKIFVGSSDITLLLIYLMQTENWVTFHGPMVATQLGKSGPDTGEEHLLSLLSGEMVSMSFPGMTSLRDGVAEGMLTGGCLTLLCSTIKTPYEIDTEEKVLFLEDTNEAPYRIDRMLSYLKAVNKFDRVRGVIFGQMPGCQPEALHEVILDLLGEFHFPILFGFPSGHGEGVATLPFGTSVTLNATEQAVRLREPAVC